MDDICYFHNPRDLHLVDFIVLSMRRWDFVEFFKELLQLYSPVDYGIPLSLTDDTDEEWFLRNCWKVLSVISNHYYYQKFSPKQISDTPQAEFEHAKDLSLSFVEWNYAVVTTATPWCHFVKLIRVKRMLSKHLQLIFRKNLNIAIIYSLFYTFHWKDFALI